MPIELRRAGRPQVFDDQQKIDQLIKLREQKSPKLTNREIAEIFGCSVSLIEKTVRRLVLEEAP